MHIESYLHSCNLLCIQKVFFVSTKNIFIGIALVNSVPPPPPPKPIKLDDDDCTGDSGVGTGSGSAQYGAVEEWRHAIRNPPPGFIIISVMKISSVTLHCIL